MDEPVEQVSKNSLISESKLHFSSVTLILSQDCVKKQNLIVQHIRPRQEISIFPNIPTHKMKAIFFQLLEILVSLKYDAGRCHVILPILMNFHQFFCSNDIVLISLADLLIYFFCFVSCFVGLFGRHR